MLAERIVGWLQLGKNLGAGDRLWRGPYTLDMSARPVVTAFWDPEAQVWVAETDTVVGLATEAGSLKDLNERLKKIVPELLAENGLDGVSADFELVPLESMPHAS